MADTTPRFTKDDFLNAAALVKKLSEEYDTEYDLETVKKALKSEFNKKTKFKTKFNMTQMVYDARWNYRESLRLHPLAIEKFKEILDKGK